MQRCVLLKCGELVLKGRNRWRFEAALRRNLEAALDGVGPVRIERREGVYVVTGRAGVDQLLPRCRDVIGLSLLHPSVRVGWDLDAAAEAALTLLAESGPAPAGRSFAIRARRRHKGFPVTSERVAATVGDAVRRASGMRVDLTRPDVEIDVEVDVHEIFVHIERIPGIGGLPVGASGDALVLLSGGIDSPVAGYRAMRRGLHCDFVHFTGAPYTDQRSAYKAYALVRRLSRFEPGARLTVVPFGRAQRAIAAAGAGRLGLLVQRRLMVAVASRLAAAGGAQALVTGDSLGQVASQTLPNLAVVDAAAELPILRPLLGFDKSEIQAEAVRIGTYPISELPDQDCCSMLASRHAETRAVPADLERIERRLDVPALVEELLAARLEFTPGQGDAEVRIPAVAG